jgi:hypothetical protein
MSQTQIKGTCQESAEEKQRRSKNWVEETHTWQLHNSYIVMVLKSAQVAEMRKCTYIQATDDFGSLNMHKRRTQEDRQRRYDVA